MHLTVLPLQAEKGEGRFDVYEALVRAVSRNGEELKDGDVVVISTKYVAGAQGRIVNLRDVRVSETGVRMSGRFRMMPEMAELVLRESDEVFGGIPGFVMTTSGSIMAPNAGIDRSNAKGGSAILYPAGPHDTAEQIRRKVYLNQLVHVGIILADSRLMPARVGTSGVAVASAGIEPVADMRSRKDLDGNRLKVTFKAVADNLAAIANHTMGEGAESTPFAIVRDSGAVMTDRRTNPAETAVPAEQCVYVRGLADRSMNEN